jgi:hypothetical protein
MVKGLQALLTSSREAPLSRIANPFKLLWQFIRRSLKTPGRKRREEATCLRKEIENRMGENNRDPDCFLTHRFERPLLRHRKWGAWYGRIFTSLSLAAIVAGTASSAIKTNKDIVADQNWILIVLGLVVAITTAVNQLWKPGLRSVGSHRAGNALLREGWDFTKGRGRYQEAPGRKRAFGLGRGRPKEITNATWEKAFALFVDQVREIQAQVDAIDEVQAEAIGEVAQAKGGE